MLEFSICAALAPVHDVFSFEMVESTFFLRGAKGTGNVCVRFADCFFSVHGLHFVDGNRLVYFNAFHFTVV